jgi:hypothetical protein
MNPFTCSAEPLASCGEDHYARRAAEQVLDEGRRMQSDARRRGLTNDPVLLNGVYPDDSCHVLWENGDLIFRRGWRLGDDGKPSAMLVVTPAAEHPSPALIGTMKSIPLIRSRAS